MNAKQIIIAGTLLVSVATFAQKDELKALKKIYAKDVIKGADLAEYKALVNKVQPLATEEGDKVYAGFYKAMIPVLEYLALDQTMPKAQIQATMAKFVNPTSISDLAAGLNATLDYEKKTGKKVQTDEIKETITSFKPEMISYADALGKAEKYKEAFNVLYSIYQLDKKDQEMLYYAANYAVNGKDFDAALKYYQELKDANYSGEGTMYYATEKVSKKEEYLGNTPAQRDLLVKTGQYEKPRNEKIPSKRGEIYKNIALILVEKGKTDEAKTAIVEARKLNPDDTSLLTTEADLYFKLNDMESYKKLVNEALEKNPNDVDLIFNLGVVSGNANKIEDAEKYYKRAIEINPNYVNAYLNLSELYLRADEKFVTEMNKLGNNDKDNKRYEVIKADRDKNFKKVMPLLKKVIELDDKNESARTILLSVYNALDMQSTPEYKELKAKM